MENQSDLLRKRKHIIPDSSDSETVFKKAKHWWQVKGRSPQLGGSGDGCSSSTSTVDIQALEQSGTCIDNLSEVHVGPSCSVNRDCVNSSVCNPTSTEYSSHAEATCSVDSEHIQSSEAEVENHVGVVEASIEDGRNEESNRAIAPVASPAHTNTCTWMKRNTAHAIVDNVFNQTLEEMGLSPNDDVNRNIADRLEVESRSISTIIDKHGLSPVKKLKHSSDIKDEKLSKNLQIIQTIKCQLVDKNAAEFHKAAEETFEEPVPSCSSIHPGTRSEQPHVSMSSVCEADSTADSSPANHMTHGSFQVKPIVDTCCEISTTLTQMPYETDTHHNSCNHVSNSRSPEHDSSISVQQEHSMGAIPGHQSQQDLCRSTTTSLELDAAYTYTGSLSPIPSVDHPERHEGHVLPHNHSMDQSVASTSAASTFLDMAVSAAISSQGLAVRDRSF